MSLHRVKQLLERVAKSGYVDVLKDTLLEQHGKNHGFGPYVVRGWAADCYRMFGRKSGEPGGTKLGSNKRHYSTIQAVLNECTCKYNYAGTAKHVVTQLYEGGDNGVRESGCTSEEGEEDQWG